MTNQLDNTQQSPKNLPSDKTIPTIDASLLWSNAQGSNAQAGFQTVADQIGKACKEFGFFQLVGHPLKTRLIDEFSRAMKHFFLIPKSAKAQIKRSQNNARGWFNDELTKQKMDWKEGFDFGAVPYPALPCEHEKNVCQDGQNQWPVELTNFKPTMQAYFAAMVDLSVKLNEAMAVGLGLDPNHFVPCFDKHSSFLRLNHYPKCHDPAHHLGISPHSDAGWLTILAADPNVRSLQILHHNRWLTLKPEPGTFIINTGDMAQVFSNDRYKAPVHRVLGNRDHARYSAAFFFNPNYDATIEPILSHPGETSRYRRFKWGEFRAKRFLGDYADVGEENQISHYSIDPALSRP